MSKAGEIAIAVVVTAVGLFVLCSFAYYLYLLWKSALKKPTKS
jgi:hypothetical protein